MKDEEEVKMDIELGSVKEKEKSSELKKEELKEEGGGERRELKGIVQRDVNGRVEICYNPQNNDVHIQDEEVYILGEFNQWNPESMNKILHNHQYIYVAKFTLKEGFKYRFNFIVNNLPTIDINLPFSQNAIGYLLFISYI
jgi:hypothetical protein